MSAQLTPMQLLRAEGKLSVDEPGQIFGYWRGHEIWLQRNDESIIGGWYIQVKHPDGCYLYDGWWRPDGYVSPDDVVAQAFEGACLLEDE